MDKERLRSILRRAAIVLLVVTAVLLLRQTEFFSSARSGPAAVETSEWGSVAAANAEASAALRPRAVAVRSADGTGRASVVDGENTQQAFRRVSAFLGEALGSAGEPEEIGEAEFRDALRTENVLVDPGALYPLELLSDWLGIGAGGVRGWSGDLLCLVVEGERVSLCFRDGAGGFYRCATAAQAETLSARIAEFQGARASFAYENPLLEGVEPYFLVSSVMPELKTVSAASSAETVGMEALTASVGMNSRLVTSYYDADGTLVLNEDEKALRLSRDGTMSYRAPDTPVKAAGEDLTAAVNLAYRLAENSAGRGCGDAEVCFAGVETQENGWYTVFFDYSLRGVPVLLPEGRAVTVTVGDGAVRWAQAALRRYSFGEEPEAVLPALQAAAAAAAQGVETPALVYLDAGDHVRCDWVVG